MRPITLLLLFAILAFMGYKIYQDRTAKKTPAPVEQVAQPDFAGMLLPHLQATFSALNPNDGKLDDRQLTRLRAYFAQYPTAPGQAQALAICDQLVVMASQREDYRQKCYAARSGSGNSSFWQDQITRQWLAQAPILARPLQHAYAQLDAIPKPAQLIPVDLNYAPYFERTGIAAPNRLGEAIRDPGSVKPLDSTQQRPLGTFSGALNHNTSLAQPTPSRRN